MQQLKAIKPLSGNYGRVEPGAVFFCQDDIAEQLEARGLAYRYYPPAPRRDPESFVPTYKTKVIAPEQTASFRPPMAKGK
jgi:hypothetical protein